MKHPFLGIQEQTIEQPVPFLSTLRYKSRPSETIVSPLERPNGAYFIHPLNTAQLDATPANYMTIVIDKITNELQKVKDLNEAEDLYLAKLDTLEPNDI